MMNVKINYKRMLKSEISKGMGKLLCIKLEKLDTILEQYSGDKNKEKASNYVKNLESDTGGFNQLGMWKLKTQLCPKPVDPPMAKVDERGKLVTSPHKLRKLYLETYSKRLEHRRINVELEDIFELKN
jgi:hypothetical protein